MPSGSGVDVMQDVTTSHLYELSLSTSAGGATPSFLATLAASHKASRMPDNTWASPRGGRRAPSMAPSIDPSPHPAASLTHYRNDSSTVNLNRAAPVFCQRPTGRGAEWACNWRRVRHEARPRAPSAASSLLEIAAIKTAVCLTVARLQPTRGVYRYAVIIIMVHTLVGIGSLVSEASARQSFAFRNFRIGEVCGWRRAFNQANWVNVQHGWGSVARGDVAALAMIPASTDFISHVALLDVDDEDLVGFYEREAGYHIRSTPFCRRGPDGAIVEMGSALMCTACANDAEADALWAPGGEMEKQCSGSEYAAAWMAKSLRPLWPESSARLLPSPGYLRLCAAAHLRAGLLDHFLDSTLLNDRSTTLREHCDSHLHNPSQVLMRPLASTEAEEEETPPSVHGASR